MLVGCICIRDALEQASVLIWLRSWCCLRLPDRSVGALGDSSRDFSVRVAGNFATSAMSSSDVAMLSYMQVAYSACSSKPEVYNLSNGIRLPFASTWLVEHF